MTHFYSKPIPQRQSTLWLAGVLLLLSAFVVTFLALSVLISGPVAAQGNLPPGITANDVNDVADDLWCPLCSGVRLDACELKACDQMKDVIAIKLSEGENAEDIKTYFLGQYGPQVLGEPPRSGFNWIAWIMPFAVMLAGGGFLWLRARKMVGSGLGLETEGAGDGAQAGRTEAEKKEEKSDYDRKLEEELNRYG